MSDQSGSLQLELMLDEELEPPPSHWPDAQLMQRWAQAALLAEDDCSVCVRVVGNEEAQSLNRQYRDRDYPTNVLSFPAEMPALPGLSRTLGDLVLCAPVISREALEQGKPEASHWAHMLVHGLLHLQGMDHQDDAEADAMEALEVQILGQLGVPNPYLDTDLHPAPSTTA